MSAAQQKELISKFWDQVSEFWGLTLPNTRQGKKIRKDFLVSCKQLIDDTVSIGNAAESAACDAPATKKSSTTTKRVKDEAESGDPKSKKVVIIEPKAKKSTTKKAESPVPTKKKSATSNKK